MQEGGEEGDEEGFGDEGDEGGDASQSMFADDDDEGGDADKSILQRSLKDGGIDGLTKAVSERVNESIKSGQISAKLEGKKKWILRNEGDEDYKSIIVDI